MKRLFALLFVILIIPFLTQSYNAVENDTEEKEPAKLVALGDSITKGYGLNDGEKCYVDIVAEECGFEAENFAVNGRTSVVLLESLKNPSDSEKRALENADYIVMSIGGNDMLYLLNNLVNDVVPSDGTTITSETINSMLELAEKLTPESMNPDISYYKKTVAEIIEIIQGLNDHAVITVQTVYNPFKPIFVVAPLIVPTQADQINAAQNSIDNCIDGFNNVLNELSKTYGFKIADVCTDFKNSDKKLLNMSLQNPDIHPNAAGHKRIAELVEEAIDPDRMFTAFSKTENCQTSDKTANIDTNGSSMSTDSVKDTSQDVTKTSKPTESDNVSTKIVSEVENSADSKKLESENDDYSQRLFIFIGIMAVLSALITFARVRGKSK